MDKHAVRKLRYIILALVIVVSATVRLYRITPLHTFHNDEGRDVLIALRMIQDKQPVLLGPQTSTGNMYLGPLYYYMMVPALILSGYDPVGPAIMVAILGIITAALIFWHYHKKIGILGATASALVFSVTPMIVTFTRNSWNPNVIPFFALLVLFVAENLLQQKEIRKNFLFLGILSGVLIQLHYVSLILPLTILVYTTILTKPRVIQFVHTIGLTIIGFLLTTLPYWIFELRHNWINIRALFSYVTSQNSGEGSQYLERLIRNLRDFTEVLVGSRPNNPAMPPVWLGIVFWLVVFSIVLFSLKKSQKNKHLYGLVITLILTSVPIYSVISQRLEIHYLSYLFPVYALVLGIGISRHRVLRYPSLVAVAAIVVYNLPILWNNVNIDSTHQVERTSKTAAYIARDAGLEPYNVVPSASNSRDTTYLYHLALLDNPPTIAITPTVYMICEDAPCEERDVNSPLIFSRGPAHPSLDLYNGHPFIHIYRAPRRMVSMEHIAYGTWVAKIYLEP